MEMPLPPIEPMPKVDVGELLMETVKNAPILPVSLMEAVAMYVNYQSRPVMTIETKVANALFKRGKVE